MLRMRMLVNWLLSLQEGYWRRPLYSPYAARMGCIRTNRAGEDEGLHGDCIYSTNLISFQKLSAHVFSSSSTSGELVPPRCLLILRVNATFDEVRFRNV